MPIPQLPWRKVSEAPESQTANDALYAEYVTALQWAVAQTAPLEANLLQMGSANRAEVEAVLKEHGRKAMAMLRTIEIFRDACNIIFQKLRGKLNAKQVTGGAATDGPTEDIATVEIDPAADIKRLLTHHMPHHLKIANGFLTSFIQDMARVRIAMHRVVNHALPDHGSALITTLARTLCRLDLLAAHIIGTLPAEEQETERKNHVQSQIIRWQEMDVFENASQAELAEHLTDGLHTLEGLCETFSMPDQEMAGELEKLKALLPNLGLELEEVEHEGMPYYGVSWPLAT